MKFIIQQFGNHWLVKAYVNSEEGQAVAKGDDAIREVAPTLAAAVQVATGIAVQHGITPQQLGAVQ